MNIWMCVFKWLTLISAQLEILRKSEPLNVESERLTKAPPEKGCRGARSAWRQLLSVAPSYPRAQPAGLGSTHLSLHRPRPRLVSDTNVLFLLPCYYAWQLLVHEFLHALVFRGTAEKPPKRFNVSAVVRKQAPHGRCHVWFLVEDREGGEALTSPPSFPSSFSLYSPPPIPISPPRPHQKSLL